MTDDVLNLVWVPLGRILAGFVVGLLLATLGILVGFFLNAFLGYPWSLAVHQNIQMVSIGIGAGLGSYLAWVNPTHRWYWILGGLALVLTGSTLGAFLGRAYGPGVDPSYWWTRFAVDTTIPLGAAIAGISISTAIGLGGQLRTTVHRKVQGMRRNWS